MTEIFKVYIDGSEHRVFDIPGKEHEGLNNTPKTWWMHFKPFTGLSQTN